MTKRPQKRRTMRRDAVSPFRDKLWDLFREQAKGMDGADVVLALKQAGMVQQIVGAGRSLASLQRALELGIIDAIATSVADAVADADLVLIAAPVAQTGAILASIQPHLQIGTIVTDAGSTKGDVEASARLVAKR